MTSFAVQNSVAFVTGTNKKNGIGRSIVEALLANGAKKVYATARRTSQLDDLVATYGDRVVAVQLDVTDLKSIEELASKYPDVTLVVNNAGFFGATSSLDDVAVVQHEMMINYIAPLAIVKSFSPLLKKAASATSSSLSSRSSAIVNIASIASLVNFPAGGTYSASKAATHSLTQAQRRDLSKSLVIGVYPGPIDTTMAKDISFEKAAPSVVSDAVIDALKNGQEDVFPDEMAAGLYEGWKADAKALEKQMAQSVQEEKPDVER